MKILILGKNGQVGFEILKLINKKNDILAPSKDDLNLVDLPKLRKTVQEYKPDVIINSSGYTRVDDAEFERETATILNEKVPDTLAQEGNKINSLLVHFSTDYVFDGMREEPYIEEDDTNPLNFYGLTKLKGEKAIQKNCKKFVILRTSWVVGSYGENFIKKILDKAKKKEKILIVDDQIGAPTWSKSLAQLTVFLLEKYQKNNLSFPYGVYHASAKGKTNWYDLAKYVINFANSKGEKLNISVKDIFPVNSSFYKSSAKRPNNSILDNNKLCDSFNFKFPCWREGIDEIMSEILNDKK